MPSSVIAQVEYHDATLKIVYISGAVYEYQQVPESVFMAMKAATSKGSFLNRCIKGKYSYKKLK